MLRHTPRILTSFFQRDARIELSYKLAFILNFTGVIFSVLSFFFISRLVDSGGSFDGYDTDYFTWILPGIALANYFTLGLGGFASSLREAQTTGTLEAMIMTPTPLSTIIVGSALWNYFFTTIRVLFYLLLGVLLGARFPEANLPASVVMLALSVIAFASIGIIAASLIMVVKRGNPITGFIGNIAVLISGIWYPVETLPDWLQPFSWLLPLRYAVDGVRGALLDNASLAELRFELLGIIGFCIVLVPLSLYIFRYAVTIARQDGTLTHY